MILPATRRSTRARTPAGTASVAKVTAEAAEELSAITFEEFLARERRSERRHEYVGGRVYLMDGGSERHDLAAGLALMASLLRHFPDEARPAERQGTAPAQS